MRFYFDRTKLPTPEAILKLLKAEEVSVHGPQLSARCPFQDHTDRNPSFSMHGHSGKWRCFGCHRSGGDVLALYMQVNRLPFVESAKALGAWRAE